MDHAHYTTPNHNLGVITSCDSELQHGPASGLLAVNPLPSEKRDAKLCPSQTSNRTYEALHPPKGKQPGKFPNRDKDLVI